jgi:hypothetical protein
VAKLSDKEVGNYAYNAGVKGEALDLATAIAVANLESGFDPGAKADDSDDLSYGLWQINMKGSLGPSRRAKFGLASNEALYDPATNARVMAALSDNGKKWGAWTTFTTGPAKLYALRYLTVAGDVIHSNGGGGAVAGVVGAAQGAADAASATANFASDASQALRATHAWLSDRRNWVRVAFVVVGGVILVGSLIKVTSPVFDSAKRVVGR